MGEPVNLDLFGGPPHPIRSGKTDGEALEQKRRERAYHKVVTDKVIRPVCLECKRPLVLTPSFYYVCEAGHTKLIDPRDFTVQRIEDEDESQLPVSGDRRPG